MDFRDIWGTGSLCTKKELVKFYMWNILWIFLLYLYRNSPVLSKLKVRKLSFIALGRANIPAVMTLTVLVLHDCINDVESADLLMHCFEFNCWMYGLHCCCDVIPDIKTR